MVFRRKIKSASIIAISSLLLANCAPQLNVDDQLDVVALPAEWQSPNMETAKAELDWLGSDEVDDLPEIVIKALANNPDLRISANRLRTSLAQQSITDGARSIQGDIRVGA